MFPFKTSADNTGNCFIRYQISDVPVCAAPPTCAPHQFQCNSGECIDQRLRCNQRYDCRDGSDETECGEFL